MSTQPEDMATEAIKKMAVGAATQSKGLRDAHPKAHGCVTAKFIVDPSMLPQEARVGVFKEPHTFDAWIRFSNGNLKPQSDVVADVRGMAIKLLGVQGLKLLEKEQNATTQDFHLISHQVFFARNAQEFLTIFGFATNNPPPGVDPAKFARELGILAASQDSTIKNPLAGTYWTTVPFRLGPHVAKYRASSSSPVELPADISSHDFLREAMKAHLTNKEARFEVSAQLFDNATTTPIEDPTVPWGTPFLPVATIVIPPQEFTSDARKEFCENLSFTPWHSLPEHEPLGAINIARKPIYAAVSAERHAIKQVPEVEPK